MRKETRRETERERKGSEKRGRDSESRGEERRETEEGEVRKEGGRDSVRGDIEDERDTVRRGETESRGDRVRWARLRVRKETEERERAE